VEIEDTVGNKRLDEEWRLRTPPAIILTKSEEGTGSVNLDEEFVSSNLRRVKSEEAATGE
jgi:hypothetical protein